MNVWALILDAVGWIVLAILAIIMLLVIAGLILGAIRFVQSRRRNEKAPEQTDESIRIASKSHAEQVYQDSIFSSLQIGAFQRGAEFALNKKRGNDVSSV